MSTDHTEQWLSDGKCSICRRKNYCKKPCKACNKRKNYEMTNLMAQAVMNTYARLATNQKRQNNESPDIGESEEI